MVGGWLRSRHQVAKRGDGAVADAEVAKKPFCGFKGERGGKVGFQRRGKLLRRKSEDGRELLDCEAMPFAEPPGRGPHGVWLAREQIVEFPRVGFLAGEGAGEFGGIKGKGCGQGAYGIVREGGASLGYVCGEGALRREAGGGERGGVVAGPMEVVGNARGEAVPVLSIFEKRPLGDVPGFPCRVLWIGGKAFLTVRGRGREEPRGGLRLEQVVGLREHAARVPVGADERQVQVLAAVDRDA